MNIKKTNWNIASYFSGFKTTTTPGPKLTSDGCPKGYICSMGAFFGICCEENLTSK